MRTSEQGLEMIRRWEGFSSTVYLCPAGIPTIGYGHVVHHAEAFAMGISTAQAVQLLRADVAVAEVAVARLISAPLRQGQWDALVSFTFNLGAGRLQMSRLRRLVNRGEHAEVPAQLMRWVYAGGRILPGLVKRRAEEARCYANTGTAGETVRDWRAIAAH